MSGRKSPQLRKGEWKDTLVPLEGSVQMAVKVLNQVALKIVLVVDKSGRLHGTVADGDIRRGLLHGHSLSSPISQIMNPNPLVAHADNDSDTIASLMKTNRIQQIPIVDKQRRIVGLHTWEKLNPNNLRLNLFVIMAGGEGRRLRPYTKKSPKPMLPIKDRPLLEHIITKAKKEGFYKFVITTHYLGSVIENYFGNGRSWGVEISYCREKKPLGTAGSLGLISQKPVEPIVVTNGDILADFSYSDLLDFHIRNTASATMAVRSHVWENPFGVIETNGIQITRIQEKPTSRSIVNTGVYVLAPIALKAIPKCRHLDMTALFTKLQSKKMRTIAYLVHESWLDIGNPSDLIRAQKNYLS